VCPDLALKSLYLLKLGILCCQLGLDFSDLGSNLLNLLMALAVFLLDAVNGCLHDILRVPAGFLLPLVQNCELDAAQLLHELLFLIKPCLLVTLSVKLNLLNRLLQLFIQWLKQLGFIYVSFALRLRCLDLNIFILQSFNLLS